MVSLKDFTILSVQIEGQDGIRKTQVWDTRNELKLANPCGIQIRWNNLGVEVWDEKDMTYCPVDIHRDSEYERWSMRWISDAGMSSEITFQPPIYGLPIQFSHSDGDSQLTDSVMMLAFSGVNNFLLTDSKFKKKFQAKLGAKTVFELENTGSIWKVTANLAGVFFKNSNSEVFAIQQGKSVDIDGPTLVNGIFFLDKEDANWWTIKAFNRSHTSSLFLADDEVSDEDFSDKKRTRNTLFAGVVLSLATFSLFLSLRPQIKVYTDDLLDSLEPVEIRLQRVKQKSAQLDADKKALEEGIEKSENPVSANAKTEDEVETPIVELPERVEKLTAEAPPPAVELPESPPVVAEPVVNQAPIIDAKKVVSLPAPTAITPVVLKKPEVKMANLPIEDQQSLVKEVQKSQVAKLSKVIEDPSARLIAQNKESLQAAFGNLLTQAPAKPTQLVSGRKVVKRSIASENQMPPATEEKIKISEKIPVNQNVAASDFKLRSIATKHAEVKKEEVIDANQGRSLVELNKDDLDLSDAGGGILSKNAVEVVIRSQLTKIRSCHETALMDNDDLDGVVTVDFTVSVEGSVQGSRIKNSTVNDKSLEKCILRVVNLWRFPKPQGGTVSVTYPFTFKTLGGGND